MNLECFKTLIPVPFVAMGFAKLELFSAKVWEEFLGYLITKLTFPSVALGFA